MCGHRLQRRRCPAVIGLEAVGVSVTRNFACDIAWRREWIKSITTHENLIIYEDMLEREYDTLPNFNAYYYYCSFPCKPWSLLNNHSKFPTQALELAE